MARLFLPLILTAVSLPGRYIAFSKKQKEDNKIKIVMGIIVSFILQYGIYLIYLIFVIDWTKKAILEQTNQFIIWPIAFLIVIIPLWSFLNTFREQVEKEKSILNDKEEKDKKIWMEIVGTKY